MAASIEETLFGYVDRVHDIVSTETWQRVLMDLSKNDALAMMHLYRRGESRMSEVAEALRAPLNTATGVVARLQRRGYVERRNSPDDKRVVVVALTDEGRALVREALGVIVRNAQRLLAVLTPDELDVLIRTADRVIAVLQEESRPRPEPARPSRRIPID